MPKLTEKQKNCLHDMKRVVKVTPQNAIKQAKQGEVHVCRFCKYRAVYHKEPKTGRIDNARYLKDLVRDFAQPGGRTGHIFKRVHGNKKLEDYKPRHVAKKENRKGWDELAKLTRQDNKTFL